MTAFIQLASATRRFHKKCLPREAWNNTAGSGDSQPTTLVVPWITALSRLPPCAPPE